MELVWKEKNPKIENSTLCNDYDFGGLKNAVICSNVVRLQCSWIKRLFDNNFHHKINSTLPYLSVFRKKLYISF